MSLDKAIQSGKEKREMYRRDKAIDASCRNHGDDPWAKHSRLHSNDLRRQIADEQLKEYMKEYGNGEESCKE